jgi:hypothetical protein
VRSMHLPQKYVDRQGTEYGRKSFCNFSL